MSAQAAAPIPLVPIRSTWLDTNSARIRSRPIPWEGYQRAELVSAAELKLIKKVDKPALVDATARIPDADAPEYALLYLRLLTKLSRNDTLQQVLVLIDDLLADRDDRASLFFDAASQPDSVPSDTPLPAPLPWGPFVKLLDASEEFVQVKAAQFLLLLLVSKNGEAPSGVFTRLVDYLSTLVQNASEDTGAPAYLTGTGYADGNALDLGTQLLNALLRNASLRSQFWSLMSTPKADTTSAPILTKLLDILTTTVSTSSSPAGAAALSANSGSGGRGTNQGGLVSQYQYQIILNFWLLSFDDTVAGELNNEQLPVVTVLIEVGSATNKEKVFRIIMATFTNLLYKAPETNSHALLGAKVLPLVENLLGRKWSDEDLVADLKELQAVLSEKLKSMTTLDVYIAELDSGRLTWDNPLHESDEFWVTATPRLLEEHDTGLNKLLDLTTHSTDATTLAVACNDLGKIVVVSETAKRVVNKSPAKVRLMELMSHDDKDVKFYALHAVGKLVSAAWR